jgi:hypothetical protein
MAGVSCTPQEGDLTRDSDGATYTRTYYVQMNNVNDGPLTVASYWNTATGLSLGDPYTTGYESDSKAILKKAQAKPVPGEHFLWTVNCEWNSKQEHRDAAQPPGDQVPTARPALIKATSVQTEAILVEDKSGPPAKKVLNSAGCEFTEPVTYQLALGQIQITKYKNSATYAQIEQYINKTNSDVFLGFAAGKLRCTEYGITQVYEQGAFYWQIDVTLLVAPTHNIKVLDRGLYQLDPSVPTPSGPNDPPQLRRIRDQAGEPLEAQLLDGNGRLLVPPANPVYLEFQPYETTAFAGLL